MGPVDLRCASWVAAVPSAGFPVGPTTPEMFLGVFARRLSIAAEPFFPQARRSTVLAMTGEKSGLKTPDAYFRVQWEFSVVATSLDGDCQPLRY